MFCDACGEDIRMTRYMCLDCSAGRYVHTLDICVDCVDKTFTATREKGAVKLDHLPTHSILQIRRPLPLLLQLLAREFAQFTIEDVLPNAEDSEGICCKDCGNHVQRPYWACCKCSGKSLNEF
jgi:hypothetical protein